MGVQTGTVSTNANWENNNSDNENMNSSHRQHHIVFVQNESQFEIGREKSIYIYSNIYSNHYQIDDQTTRLHQNGYI